MSKYILAYPLSFFYVLVLSTGCATTVSYISTPSDAVPVAGVHLIELSINDPKLKSLSSVSHLFEAKKDTFRITLIDKNKNGLYNDPDDIFVVSSTSPYVPVYVDFNPNVARLSDTLVFSFKGNVFNVEEIAESGMVGRIRYLGKSEQIDVTSAAVFEDYINPNFKLKDIYTTDEILISQILEKHPQQYAYFHFWFTSCPPCMEEVPYIQELEAMGVLTINIANESFDKSIRLQEVIAQFNYPGLHYYGSPEVVRNFGQNGFPFGILSELETGRKLLVGSNAMEALQFLLSSKNSK